MKSVKYCISVILQTILLTFGVKSQDTPNLKGASYDNHEEFSLSMQTKSGSSLFDVRMDFSDLTRNYLKTIKDEVYNVTDIAQYKVDYTVYFDSAKGRSLKIKHTFDDKMKTRLIDIEPNQPVVIDWSQTLMSYRTGFGILDKKIDCLEGSVKITFQKKTPAGSIFLF